MEFNNLIITKKYVLNTRGRLIKSSENGVYIFQDESVVDLNTGKIKIDNKSGSNSAFILITLLPGIQTISTGTKNENPTTKSWTSNKIIVAYKGDIVINPSTDGKIQISENEHCFSTLSEDGTIVVTESDYQTLTINSDSQSISDISTGNVPPLQISAPTDTEVTLQSGTLKFLKLGKITMRGGNLDGVETNTVTANLSSSSTIAVKKIDTLSVESTTFLDIHLDTAQTVNLNAKSQINLYVTTSIEKLTLNCQSFINVTGGQYKNLNVEYCKSSVTLKKINRIIDGNIKAKSFITLEGTSANDLTIEGDSHVTIALGTCKKLNIAGKSFVNINGTSFEELDITAPKGAVTIKVNSFSVAKIESSSFVNVQADAGEQELTVTGKSSVTATLATAKKVTINTKSFVTVKAYKFLTKPDITTTSFTTVDNR